MRYVTLAAAGLLFVGGCTACGHKECPVCNPKAAPEAQLRSEAAAPSTTAAQVKVYPVAPAELVKRIEAALKAQGFSITSSQAGVIQTDWKDYPGEFHIARRWDEQSRFRVSVVPDVNNPTGASRFEV